MKNFRSALCSRSISRRGALTRSGYTWRTSGIPCSVIPYGAAFVKKHPSLFDGQMLHAQSLTLTHPRTGEKMTFHAPLPDNFERALSILRKMQQPIG